MANATINKTIEINRKASVSVAQLCTSIYLRGHDRGPAILAVTSSDPREGRSSLALAIGVQVSQMFGSPTLVVEANFRHPGMGRLIDLPKDSPGLADVMSGRSSLDNAIVSLGPNQPDVLTAGQVEDDGSSILMNRDQMEKALKQLNQKYSYIIVETPPVNLYPESLILVGLAGGVILTVRSGVTSRETVSLAVKKLEAANGKFLGLVLNQRQFPLPQWLYKRL